MSNKPGIRQRLGLEVFRAKRQQQKEAHELRTLFWECTLRCNVACRHCGSDCRASVEQADMQREYFLRVVDSITPHVNPHKVFVIFTGGEPLMRDDLEVCGRELYNREYPWGIVTNGLYLSRQRLDSLLKAGMHSITVSLDGLEEAHNWLRRHPKSFQQATGAIRMLAREEEIIWDVVTCVNQNNIDQLPALRDYLIGIGVRRWRIFTIFPVGRAADIPELQLSDKQFVTVLDFIESTRRENKIQLNFACEGFLGRYEAKVRDYFYHCNAGISVASVRVDGSISGCPSIRANYNQGNIYQDDFMQVWNERFAPFRDREWARQGECADCSMFRYCEGNGMHLHDETGKLLVCHFNKLKSKT
ncbi:TIGR04133 family radical SAM/SPASM protein [Butyricimonas synergistica]|uniref:TIGR04133 family radical SAM/SPASM protein n=1 Tax=Butyricimonas synergistica TaxID=544644 RepID=UPI000379F209|nr:TIGR04133 family radical SAM/SPASM protein [Butyricimonas synergistica]